MCPEHSRRLPAPFIVGVSRSGTTMLRLMLDSHPQLAIPPETRFMPGLIELVGANAKPDVAADFLTSWERWSDFHLDPDELRARLREASEVDAGAAARCLFELYAEGQGKPRWGDKSPPYVNHVGAIHAAIGEAVIIHLIRDGRDVCASMMRRQHGMKRPRRIARRWVREVGNARAQGTGLPDGAYIEVRYEELVAEPERVLRSLCDRLELDWDSAMLSFHTRAQERLAEITDIVLEGDRFRTAEERLTQFERVASPLTDERVEAWRTDLSESQRRRFEAIAGDLLRELSYPIQ